MSIIEAQGLSKTFKYFEKEAGLLGSVKGLFHRVYTEKNAVSDLDLRIEKGEFVGLIGENGAGKTTLIKMLTGIIAPTGGSVTVLGYTPNKLENAYKKRFAVVMGQKSQLFFDLTAADTFLLLKELYELRQDEFERNRDYLVALFGVEKQLNVQVRTLSLGQRMKMELIAALLHDPEILFLDEPTIGLDAMAQRQMREFLKKVNEEKGTTILLTSHYMQDIQSLCKRVVVIGQGQKIYDGSLHDLLLHNQQYKKITVTYHNHVEPSAFGGLPVTVNEDGGYTLLVKKNDVPHALSEMIALGELTDLSVEEEDIGLVVERIYGRKGDA